jgi:hypothetical protein
MSSPRAGWNAVRVATAALAAAAAVGSVAAGLTVSAAGGHQTSSSQVTVADGVRWDGAGTDGVRWD